MASIACSIPLAWLGVKVHQARQQHAAVREIEALGASVWYETRPSEVWGTSWLRSFFGEDFNANVKAVNYSVAPHRKATDADLVQLKRLPRLHALNLRNQEVTDLGMVCVSELADLESLDIGKNPITDRGVQQLTRLTKLRQLALDRTQVTDVGVGYLGRMVQLESLSLGVDAITDEGTASPVDPPPATEP